MTDIGKANLAALIKQAQTEKTPLEIIGHGSKRFLGGTPLGHQLSTTSYAGITKYEPSELYITARAGTTIVEVEEVLAKQRQYLPFEPPRIYLRQTGEQGGETFQGAGTIGGMIATALSGPASLSQGGIRDFVLGVSMINANGEELHFGGQVMKNVAGYDVSRLLTGSMGVLGVISEVSLKVLPKPQATTTVSIDSTPSLAIENINIWLGQPLPINASVIEPEQQVIRLSGSPANVKRGVQVLAEQVKPANLSIWQAEQALTYWQSLRDQQHHFFQDAMFKIDQTLPQPMNLWRITLPSTTGYINWEGEQLVEKGGGQRWLLTSLPTESLRQEVAKYGGFATLYRSADKSPGVFNPLPKPNARWQKALQDTFDPYRIFNRGRMYPD